MHPDPLTSGGANWALLAEVRIGRPPLAGTGDSGGELRRPARRLAPRGRPGRLGARRRTQFENGFGDVLVTYEQDVVGDAARGTLPGEIVYPPSTVLSEHTLVILDKNIAPADRR